MKRILILKCEFEGMKLDPNAEVELRGKPIPIYEHERLGKPIEIGNIPRSSLSTEPGKRLLTGDVDFHTGLFTDIVGQVNPIGVVREDHTESMKVWYDPRTWRNKQVRVIDLLDIRAISVVRP